MPPFLPRKHVRSPSPVAGSRNGGARKVVPIAAVRRPTLFDDLDAGVSTPRSQKSNNDILAELGESSDASDLSSLSTTPEPELETRVSKRQKLQKNTIKQDEESDDDDEDIEFEDVDTSKVAEPASAAPAPSGDLDLTLTKETRISLTNPHGTKKGPSKIERQIRISTHCMHVQFLLWHNAVRNAWVCDKEVQQILSSQLPSGIQKEVERWKANSGLTANNTDGEASKQKKGGKGKSSKGKEPVARSQRDWGSGAGHLEAGAINMSHGDPMFRLLRYLSSYWRQRFRITAPGLRKVGYMSLQRLDEETKSFQKDKHDDEAHGERIKSLKEFRDCARRCEGSRDVGAQLFTALLRSLGMEARLVASLQPVGFSWNKSEEAAEKKKKRKTELPLSEEQNSSEGGSDNEDPPEPESQKSTKTSKTRNTTKTKDVVKARANSKPIRRSNRSNGRKSSPIDVDESTEELELASEDDDEESIIDITPIVSRKKPLKPYDRDLMFPHYWSEVLSPVTIAYVPVDALVLKLVATNDETLSSFEARGPKADKSKQVTAYIVGYSADGTAKDVTVRYLKRHMLPGKTKGFRMPVEKVPIYNHKGKVKRYEEFDWFKSVMSGYLRSEYRRKKSKDSQPLKQARNEVDDLEEATVLKPVRPEKKEVKEGEETLQSYKSSTEFILERHLRREEALVPTAKHVKMFAIKGKGESTVEEKVFLRKDVVPCKSTETWHKEGRAPFPHETPLKRVPYRAATTNRKRELAEAEAASGEKMLQGLFSRDQTDWIIPPPIENGVIPKNAYGNMDVYVPSMVPAGAIHIPRRGTARICKKLGIDFAEAVTGFEFGARMAIPIITGVVVAEENEDLLMEQWRAFEAERLRKEDEKRTKAALGMWRKFLMGMRIIERVRDEYGDEVDDSADVLNPWTNKNAVTGKQSKAETEAQRRIAMENEEDMAGGFLPEGHTEEEPASAGGFFPTRHDDEDGDGDAAEDGFVVEGTANDVADKTSRFFNEDVEMSIAPPPIEDFEDLDEVVEAKQTRKASQSGRKSRVTAKPRGAQKARSLPATPKSSKKPSRTKALLSEAEDDPKSESSLSEMDSASSDDEPAKKHSRESARPSRVSSAASRSKNVRTLPKRNAARMSAASLRSQYVELSTDEDEFEEEE